MDPDHNAKFAIHEAAREGNSMLPFHNHLYYPADLPFLLASVVESLLNVSSPRPLGSCQAPADNDFI